MDKSLCHAIDELNICNLNELRFWDVQNNSQNLALQLIVHPTFIS